MAYRLSCKVQEYPWGGDSNCPVARYGEATPENNFKAKPDGRYAEVWMGTSHPHGPSSVIKPDGSLQPLKDFILAQPEAVYGKAVNRLTDTAKKEGQIPFLFKTLAAGATLPLQIHPSKQLAEQLRPHYPEDLPDDNHKPEIGLALTDFSAFAAFRPFESIQASVSSIPELKQALGDVADEVIKGPASSPLLRKSVSKIFNRRLHEPKVMEDLVKKLAGRCKSEGDAAVGGTSAPENSGLAETFSLLNDDYPGDAGAFVCAFFMNLYRLKAGECVYVPANTIHAWHRGVCFESMAASDNVFNAAFDDGVNQEFLNLFLENVETHIGTPASHWFCRTENFARGKNGLTKRYVTPFHEFDILNTEIAAGKAEEHLPIEGPSVVLVSRGGGKLSIDGQQEMDLIEGSILLVFAGKNVTFTAGKDGMQVYRCFAE